MDIRFETSPRETMRLTTQELREQFHCGGLMQRDDITLIYSHYDRMIIGGIYPVQQSVELGNPAELRAGYFLERREAGIINLGGPGTIDAAGETYALDKLSCLYLGKGTNGVRFASTDPANPARFFMLSVPAHHAWPCRLMHKDEASPVQLGSPETSNERTIYKYIHLDGIRSCQLVMGLTVLAPGSVWNSIPPHTHTRRMEVYCYFDVPEGQRVFHFMGQPQESRHIVMSNLEAVISPPWSIHCGCGTANYGFIWGMAGENQVFTDMDVVTVPELL